MNNCHPWQLKKINLWGHFGVTSKTILPNPAFLPKIGLNWPCCLAGSSKTTLRILIFLIVLSAEYLSHVKSIATYAPQFLGYNSSVLGIVINVAALTTVISSKLKRSVTTNMLHHDTYCI